MNSNNNTGFQIKHVDSTLFSKKLTTVFLFLITIVMAAYVLKTGNLIFMAGVVAFPFALMLMNVPRFTLVVALILSATSLPMPGFNAAKLGLLPQLILIGTYILAVLMGGQQFNNKRMPGYRMVIWYGVWLVILMVARGSGFRALGSTTWGGQRYVVQFVAIFMFIVLPNFRLSKKHIYWIVWGGLCAGILGAVVTALTGSAHEATNVVDQERQSWAGPIVTALFPVIFAYKPKRVRMVSLFLMLLCLGLILLTGFRGRLIAFGAIIFMYGAFKARDKAQYFVMMAFLGIIGWGLAIVITPVLPPILQRSLSIIPGTQVGYDVMRSATNSTDWRIELWKYALTQAHEYLLIGRGMTTNIMEVVAGGGVGDFSYSNHWFMFQMHAYHSGPISLLIDLGIPGLLMYIVFTVVAFRTLWHHGKQLARMDTFVSRFALFLCVRVVWRFVAFYLIYGDVEVIGAIIMDYAVALLVANSVFYLKNKQIKSEGIGLIGEVK